MDDNPIPTSRIDRSSYEFQDRLERFREARRQGQIERKETPKDYAKKAFGEFLLGSYGFGEEDFSKDGFIKGKLGLFAEAAKPKDKSDDGGPPSPPTMETPNQEREKTNPEISTLFEQFEGLIKTANKIGVITAEQQEELRDQISSAKRNYKENQMEAEKATIETNTSSANLTPTNDEIDKLLKKFKALQEVVDEKLKEQEKEKFALRGFKQRLAEQYGIGDEYADYTKKRDIRESRIETNPGYTRNYDIKTGEVTYEGPFGPASPDDAIARRRPSRMRRVGGAFKNAGQGILNAVRNVTTARMASRVGGAAAVGGATVGGASLSSKISSLIGRGVKGAGVAASATKNNIASTVKKIAGPIITKALGSTAIKSIPIIGTAVGGLMAAKKLVQGDVVGAGLEATSGLAGPMTAVPAMIASVSRDTYSSVFNVQPERDPKFGMRMKLITGIIAGLVTAMLASKVEAKTLPTKDEVAKIETPPKPPAKVEAKPPVTSGPPIKKAPAPTEKPKIQPPPPKKKSSDKASPKPSSSGGGASSASYGDKGKESISGMAKQEAATPPPTTGMELAQKSAEVEGLANQPIVINTGGDQSVPLPSVSPTTKSGASGAGNVPDPIYYIPNSLQLQIYFNSNPATTT